jgi:hypothetical protein
LFRIGDRHYDSAFSIRYGLYLAFIYLSANARLSRTDTPTLLVIVVVLQYRLLVPCGVSRSGRFDVRLLAPKRQRCGKLACGLASQCRVRRHDSLALTYQQRATQNWAKMSWSTGAADAGAAE